MAEDLKQDVNSLVDKFGYDLERVVLDAEEKAQQLLNAPRKGSCRTQAHVVARAC